MVKFDFSVTKSQKYKKMAIKRHYNTFQLSFIYTRMLDFKIFIRSFWWDVDEKSLLKLNFKFYCCFEFLSSELGESLKRSSVTLLLFVFFTKYRTNLIYKYLGEKLMVRSIGREIYFCNYCNTSNNNLSSSKMDSDLYIIFLTMSFISDNFVTFNFFFHSSDSF